MSVATLRTPRLTLRAPLIEDADFFVEALNDMDVVQWLTVIPHPYTRDHALWFINEIAEGRERAWLIVGEDGPAGIVGLGDTFGYWLHKRVWGRGYVTEASDAVIDHAFADLGLDKIETGYFIDNERSQNALAKLGFVDAGPKMLQCLADGRTDIPSRHTVLTRDRWQDRREFRVTTDRLTIREMHDTDAADFARICGHPDVAPMLFAMTVGWPVEAAAKMIVASRYRGRIPFRATICKDGQMIGTCGIGGIGRRENPSIMYAIDPAHAGQGYTTEAMAAFLTEIDRRFAPPLIEADHFTDNPASGAVLRKLGFKKVGEGMGTSAARNGEHPNVLYQCKRG